MTFWLLRDSLGKKKNALPNFDRAILLQLTSRKLFVAQIDFDIPVFDAHGAVLGQVELHLESAVEQLRLVTDPFGQTFLGGHLQVFVENRFVLRVGAFLNDQLGPLFRCDARADRPGLAR